MANYEATRYDFDGENITGIQGLNTGLIIPWTDSSVPTGYLECNGQAVSRSTYAALFAVIGTTYGSGNGSTTFTLPDLQDNITLSKSPNKALASTGGANTVAGGGNVPGNAGNTTISTPTMASHSHPYTASPGNPGKPASQGGNVRFGQNHSGISMSNKGGGGAHSHPLSANFSGDATSVLQPYVTLMYIIKT
jgi:microcystin-dependent protein|tara:strand:- start:12438 stop:13016 length:579 start_codon:yes stop_codon:yes gene_type:complete